MSQSQNQIARVAIIKPRSVIITTRYFWRKWRPLLGNSLAVLVIEARQKCYRNLQTGEVRAWFYATLREFAQSVGFSSKKVATLLKRPHAQKFIRYKLTYVYNPELGKKVKGKCLFQVSLDDPLTPDDELQLIDREIHNDVINPEPPRGEKFDKVESLGEQPTREKVCNNYSTITRINKVIIVNTNETIGKKAEPGDSPVSLGERKKLYPNSELNESKYIEIIGELGVDSGLLKTMLQSCFIASIEEIGPAIKMVIDTPNRFAVDLLRRKYREKFAEITSEKYGKPAEIVFVSNQEIDNNRL